MPAYEEDTPEFDRYDAQVLGISIDSVFSNKAWAKSLGGISYPLLSDFWPHGMVALKYGVLRAEGFTERAIFIVDKQGKIRYIDVHPIGDQPKNSVLFEELKKIEG
jgi:alkyl hydroperoxide reductase subunit AhpC